MRIARMVIVLVLLAVAPSFAGEEATVSSEYPTLSSGVLSSARLVSLPKGTILRSGDLVLTQKDLDAEIRKSPEKLWPQLKRNLFFVMESKATQSLVAWEAQSWAKSQKGAPRDEESLTRAYFDSITNSITTTDEELKSFFDNNKDMIGDAAFDQVKDELKEYVLNQKRDEAIQAHLDGMSSRYRVDLDKDWVARQNSAAMDNVVDKARKSGEPLLVDFGADGCRPCEMMTPILDSLRKDYAGKANVLFVHVREQQILASRYGVQSIPVQVFFDKEGKEVFRHVGFFAKDQIQAKLTEMGVK